MKKILSLVLVMTMMLVGCATHIQFEDITLSNGRVIKYVTGKVAGDGQELLFRDAWSADGSQVLSHSAGGQSLWGQVLQGAVGAAMIGAGTGAGLALMKPDKINQSESNTNNFSGGNYEGTTSVMTPPSLTSETPTEGYVGDININVEGSSATSKSKAGAASLSNSSSKAGVKNTNVNQQSTTIKSKHIGGGDSCQHHCGSEQGPGNNN